MDVLERYRPIIDDFNAFQAACERPLDTTVRVNTVKTSPGRVRDILDAEGVACEAIDWSETMLKVDTDSPGRTWASFHGHIYSQEESAAIPATVLDPSPEDRIWDACAAPGGKTTQLAALMDDRGTVIANDSNLGRLSSLRFNTERLGLTSVIVTNQDGRHYSFKPFEFSTVDAALVDAPCSCEGTIRRNPDTLSGWSLDHVKSIAGVQKGILRRAIQCTEPGGNVVYSTCTFAPEENEAVVDHVLNEEACHLASIDAPIETVDGITAWQGRAFDGTLSKSIRVYPHLSDTGGFFVAKLEVDPK